VTCHRFGLRRLDAAILPWIQANHGRDKSRPNKALTGQRSKEGNRSASKKGGKKGGKKAGKKSSKTSKESGRKASKK
jgi:hypothetical protein